MNKGFVSNVCKSKNIKKLPTTKKWKHLNQSRTNHTTYNVSDRRKKITKCKIWNTITNSTVRNKGYSTTRMTQILWYGEGKSWNGKLLPAELRRLPCGTWTAWCRWAGGKQMRMSSEASAFPHRPESRRNCNAIRRRKRFIVCLLVKRMWIKIEATLWVASIIILRTVASVSKVFFLQ